MPGIKVMNVTAEELHRVRRCLDHPAPMTGMTWWSPDWACLLLGLANLIYVLVRTFRDRRNADERRLALECMNRLRTLLRESLRNEDSNEYLIRLLDDILANGRS
jgi:hypothetical protein